MKKKKLWIRKLSCGHERPTNIAFISGNYDKPKIKDKAYCRECWKEVEIIGVEEAKDDDVKCLEEIISETNKKNISKKLKGNQNAKK